MAVDTIAGLKAKMPPNERGGTTVADIHDLIDTVGEFTTQEVVTKTTNYTATVTDNRRRIIFNSASAITFILPNNLPIGWECVIMQTSTGAVTVSVTGGNLRNLNNHTRTGGTYAQAYLFVYANSGTAPQVGFSGQTAP